jgi:hypothetical protein
LTLSTSLPMARAGTDRMLSACRPTFAGRLIYAGIFLPVRHTHLRQPLARSGRPTDKRLRVRAHTHTHTHLKRPRPCSRRLRSVAAYKCAGRERERAGGRGGRRSIIQLIGEMVAVAADKVVGVALELVGEVGEQVVHLVARAHDLAHDVRLLPRKSGEFVEDNMRRHVMCVSA